MLFAHIIVASSAEDHEDICVYLKCVVFVLEKMLWKDFFQVLRKLVGKRRIKVSIDVIGDFLTIIRNGVRTAKPQVVAPHSVMRQQIANLLKEKGFIREYAVAEQGAQKELKLVLKYVDGESVIHEITRVSTPGLRTYAGSKGIKPVIGGLGVTILSTSKGVMTDKEAKELKVGGEVLCYVY